MVKMWRSHLGPGHEPCRPVRRCCQSHRCGQCGQCGRNSESASSWWRFEGYVWSPWGPPRRRWQSHMCGRCESVRGESGVIDTWVSAAPDLPPATYILDAGAGVKRLGCLAPSAPGHPAQAVREARWVIMGGGGRVRREGWVGRGAVLTAALPACLKAPSGPSCVPR